MTVLVGVYGSADSRAAIRLAAQEALYRNAPLIALTAYPCPAGLVSRRREPPHSPAKTTEPPPRPSSARRSATRSAPRQSTPDRCRLHTSTCSGSRRTVR